jgi:hypothetical protein
MKVFEAMKRTLREVYKSCLSDSIALQPELFSKKADETENSSEKQTPEEKLSEITPKSSKITKGTFRIVDVDSLPGHGVIIPAAKEPTIAEPPAQLRKERTRHSLQVPVPSEWYGRPWSYIMTFEEALKALNSDETKQAVALMKKIDKQLGIEAELRSGIYDTPDGASVVIVHDIKTPLSDEESRYVAAVKGKALLDESPDSKIV